MPGHPGLDQTRSHPLRLSPRFLLFLFVLVVLTGCTDQLPLPQIVPPTVVPEAVTREPGTPVPVIDGGLLDLPAAFRYTITVRPAGTSEGSVALITGQYRSGAWSQTSTADGEPSEELVVALDPSTGLLHSYTRAISDTTWTRWPGVSFDAAYGLASPFTLLRLRPLATQTAEAETGPDDPAGTVKVQALFSTEAVQRVLLAGVSAVALDADTRAALQTQIATLFVPQTVTYWSDSEGRIVQVAATLLSSGAEDEPMPWVEVVGQFSDYDDPAITVATPTEVTDIGDVAGESAIAEQAADVPPGVTLRVRVFANAGVPANDAIVTAYPTGRRTVADEKLGPDAQFSLNPGQYDLLVRSGSADQWLRDVTVTEGAVVAHDVLFDFSQLTITAVLGGNLPAVDVVVYPAGELNNFAGYASENPARFRLPAGLYDVEVGTQDGLLTKRVSGVEVRAGIDTGQTVDLAQP